VCAAWWPLALVIGLAVYIELLFLFGRLVRGVPAGSLLEDLVTFLGAWGLWTGAGWILLAGRVRLRLVAVGGLLTAVGFAILRRLAAVYLPSLVVSNQQQFGLLGVALSRGQSNGVMPFSRLARSDACGLTLLGRPRSNAVQLAVGVRVGDRGGHRHRRRRGR
jgi:hypothetical protein